MYYTILYYTIFHFTYLHLTTLCYNSLPFHFSHFTFHISHFTFHFTILHFTSIFSRLISPHFSTGWSPLIWAASEGHKQVVEILVEHKHMCDLSLQDTRDGNTALHWAVYKGNDDIVELLVKNGSVSLDAQNHRGTFIFSILVLQHQRFFQRALSVAPCRCS